jgi:uncharacterized small protein (DUF1192 family)
MSRTHLWAWAVVVCLFSVPMVCAQSQPASDASSGPASVAAVPRLIKFSGAVRDARGEPVTSAAVRLTFSVYGEPAGGAALWVESQVLQLDEQGHYSVLLGATRADGLPVELFPGGKARWLGVQVEGRDEDGRVLLVSVPYALKAEDAAMLGGRQASDFVLGEQLKEEVRTQVEAQTPGIATQAVEMLVSNPPKAPAIAEGPSTFTCATTGNCVLVQQTGTGRAISTAAVSSTDVVFVQQNGTGYGLRALAPGNVALYGQITSSAGTSYGVKGQTTSTTGAGVFGYNLATTGLAYGVLGQTASTEGTAFFGRATSTTGATIGLRGHADSTSGTGIMGQATATSGTTTGILGRVFSLDGTALVVDNTKGGKLLSAQVNGAEKLSVSGSGNVVASGSVTATSFAGSGSTLTGVNADLLDGLHAASFATQTVLDTEISARQSADTTLGTIIGDDIESEAISRAAADTSEATTRAAADTSLQSGILGRVLKSGDTMTGTLNLPANGLVAGTSQLVLASGKVGMGIALPTAFLHVVEPNASTAGADAGDAAWVTGGKGGDSGSFEQAGAGAAIRVTSGTGGNSFTGSVVGGGGASILMDGGGGGTGTQSGGVGATVTITAGSGGASAWNGGHGGSIILQAGSGGSGPGVGNPGSVLVPGLASKSLTTSAAFGGKNWRMQQTTGDETDAGVFDYRGFDPNALSIIGAGGAVGNRDVRIFDSLSIGFAAPGGWGGTPYAAIFNGRVGIGTSSPGADLDVKVGGTTIADAWTTRSSRRWKTNIRTIEDALDKVARLRGVSYDAKADGHHSIGVIAEEVGEVVPEVVAYEPNGVDAKSVDYARLTALLIEAVKEQQAQIQTLRSEIERLSAKLEGGVETASR